MSRSSGNGNGNQPSNGKPQEIQIEWGFDKMGEGFSPPRTPPLTPRSDSGMENPTLFESPRNISPRGAYIPESDQKSGEGSTPENTPQPGSEVPTTAPGFVDFIQGLGQRIELLESNRALTFQLAHPNITTKTDGEKAELLRQTAALALEIGKLKEIESTSRSVMSQKFPLEYKKMLRQENLDAMARATEADIMAENEKRTQFEDKAINQLKMVQSGKDRDGNAISKEQHEQSQYAAVNALNFARKHEDTYLQLSSKMQREFPTQYEKMRKKNEESAKATSVGAPSADDCKALIQYTKQTRNFSQDQSTALIQRARIGEDKEGRILTPKERNDDVAQGALWLDYANHYKIMNEHLRRIMQERHPQAYAAMYAEEVAAVEAAQKAKAEAQTESSQGNAASRPKVPKLNLDPTLNQQLLDTQAEIAVRRQKIAYAKAKGQDSLNVPPAVFPTDVTPRTLRTYPHPDSKKYLNALRRQLDAADNETTNPAPSTEKNTTFYTSLSSAGVSQQPLEAVPAAVVEPALAQPLPLVRQRAELVPNSRSTSGTTQQSETLPLLPLGLTPRPAHHQEAKASVLLDRTASEGAAQEGLPRGGEKTRLLDSLLLSKSSSDNTAVPKPKPQTRRVAQGDATATDWSKLISRDKEANRERT